MNNNCLAYKIGNLKHNLMFTQICFSACKAILTLLLLLFACACSEHRNDVDNNSGQRSPIKGLGDHSSIFEKPNPEHIIRFPQAHAPHKSYQQEWWYLTANLTTQNGESLATQWTLFRRAVEDNHWYFAHAALADSKQHQSAFRSAREDLGNLAISTTPFNARIDDWQWQSSQGLLPANLHYGNFVGIRSGENLTEIEKEYWQVNLNLRVNEQLLTKGNAHYFLQGKNGFSKKHRKLDIASHYYSQPFIDVTGKVFWQNKWQQVTGKAWFDREWGSQMLADDQQGWDWFSLRLNKNTALMVYRIRSNNSDYIYGSIMEIDGSIRTLSEKEIILKNTSREHLTTNLAYPDAFSITIASENINIKVNVINKKQIMDFGIEYFEGMVSFSGSHQGQGFLEMTGYDD